MRVFLIQNNWVNGTRGWSEGWEIMRQHWLSGSWVLWFLTTIFFCLSCEVQRLVIHWYYWTVLWFVISNKQIRRIPACAWICIAFCSVKSEIQIMAFTGRLKEQHQPNICLRESLNPTSTANFRQWRTRSIMASIITVTSHGNCRRLSLYNIGFTTCFRDVKIQW